MAPFLLCTYNVLADAYIKPAWYPGVAPALLSAPARQAALCQQIAGMGADVICLQEVEPARHQALLATLAPLGYEGLFAQKGRGRPDGCATFWRADGFTLREARTLYYQDDEPGGDSGHLALLLRLVRDDQPLWLANTHLRWQDPATLPAEHVGRRELCALAAEIAGDPEARVLCGDFNLRPHDPSLDILRQAGLVSIWDSAPIQATCYANGRAQSVDHVWYTPGLHVRLRPLPPLRDDTPLPAPGQPSDHLPLLCDIHRRVVQAGVAPGGEPG